MACSICSKKNQSDTTVFALACGHSFHRRCIAEYFQNPACTDGADRKKCPDCTNNTPTTPIKSIGIVQPRPRLDTMMSPESTVNDRRPFRALTNTPSPRRRNGAQKILLREFDLTADTDNAVLEAHSPDMFPGFEPIGQSPTPKSAPIPIPVVPASQPAPWARSGARTFLFDPDAANLPLEARLQRFKDRLKNDPIVPYNKK